jgi:ABC-type nitrate/sulfonate/bicarbonate transport system substrate-binding protein
MSAPTKILASVFAVAVLASASPAFAQLQKITVGDISPVAAAWPAMVAEDFGYFKDEGLEVTTIYTGNNAMVAQQLVGGAFDIGTTTTETTIRAIESGAPIMIVGSAMLKFPYSVVVPSTIQTAADMKGKRIVLPLPKSAPTIYWNRWLIQNGMKPSDVEQVFEGATPNRYAALESGTVQAAVLTQPFDQVALGKGYRVLMDLGTYAKDFGFNVIVVSKKTIAERPDVIRHYIKAMARAIDTIYDPAQKDKVMAALLKRAKIEPNAAAKTYDYYVNRLHPFERGAKVPPAYVQSVINLLLETGDFKSADQPVSRYLNTSFE